MTIKEYSALALRSIKPHDTKGMALCDWALGLSGEASEVIELVLKALPTYPQGLLWDDELRMEYAKEIGDVLWYVVAMANEASISFGTYAEGNINFDCFYDICTIDDASRISGIHECLSLAIEVGKVSELIKHHVAHKESLNKQKVENSLIRILQWCHLLCCYQKFNFEDVAKLNVAKLSHRYALSEGGKFNTTASAERHAKEEKFQDTQEYKEIRSLILGKED